MLCTLTVILGCIQCDCNPSGSSNLQCDEDGVCPCNPNAGGTKCDFCADGLWGLPYLPCQGKIYVKVIVNSPNKGSI